MFKHSFKKLGWHIETDYRIEISYVKRLEHPIDSCILQRYTMAALEQFND